MNYMESGMDFSPLFTKEKSIYIEKSSFLSGIGKGVKSVEFITLLGGKLYFIEAKGSAPNPKNPEGKDNVLKYCQELLEKMQHSLDLFVSREIGVNEDSGSEFPNCFDENRLANCKIVFMLIIRGHKKEWCSDIQTALQRELIALRKIWRMDVVVLNDEQTCKRRFIAEIA